MSRVSTRDSSGLRAHLDHVHGAAADLIGVDPLPLALGRLLDRAVESTAAGAHLLTVRMPDGPWLTRTRGLDEAQSQALADQLPIGIQSPGTVVVDIASARRRHGVWAWLPDDVDTIGPDDRQLLQTFARHAAMALDLGFALEESRRNEVRSQALLELSHDLAAAAAPDEVARIVAAALPGVLGGSRAAVMLWDAELGELVATAAAGVDVERRSATMRAPMRPQDIPELVDMLTHQRPLVMRFEESTGVLREMMSAVDLGGFMAVPMIGSEELLGIATASWTVDAMPDDPIETLLDRMCAVGESAALALQNTRLLGAVRHQTLHDALTGLPNRVLFADRLAEALRGSGGAAVLYCDLDRFKQVNDSYGHATGDELLRQVSCRLLAAVRGADIVARLSGDEFAILVAPLADEADATQLGQRLVACFEAPFRIDGRELRVTSSVGIAWHRDENGRAEDLVRAADAAMYAAKQRGRNQIAYAPGGQQTAKAATGQIHIGRAVHPSLETDLAVAIPNGQLRLLYQPVVDISAGVDTPVLVGAEALMRWQHPRLGLLLPAAFLPSAEETGLIADMDLWALATACRAASAWGETPKGAPVLAINLSSAALADPRLPLTIRRALAETGLPPERLHLEIVETRSLLDVPGLADRLRTLRRIGIRVALDDFGTGFSTLSWLQELPVDRIKVDRSFISNLATDASSRAVIRGVLALAAEVGLGVVAEGVETIEQANALRQAGCTFVQGYLYGRPAATDPSETINTAGVLRRAFQLPVHRPA